MMSSRPFAFSAVFAVAAIGASVSSTDAQQVAVVAETPRGWIGISFEVIEDAWGRASAIEVTEVVPGSPAAQAGVRAGDHILAINDLDEAHELAQLTSRLRLSPGDVAVAEVERDGRLSQLRMVAATVPTDVVIGSQVQVELAPLGIQTWVRQMDSLRIIIQERQGTRDVRILRDGSSAGQGRLTVVQDGDVTTIRAAIAPFEFHLFQGEQYDSLNREMVELNQVMETLRVRLIEREAEVLREDRSRGVLHLTEDNEFRRLSTMLRQASDRSATLRSAMAESARETAGANYFRTMPGQGSSVSTPLRVVEPETATPPEFRPLTPYLVGRNRIAGAEVVDVKPELADYFGVRGGVLIVDVVPGTPADRAGIRPGDVITEVDGRMIRTVEALRVGIASMRGDIELGFVRQGEPWTATLTRR
ncbi:MAG: PDZ domain-containing protein [Gemmatimonadota bacterium]